MYVALKGVSMTSVSKVGKADYTSFILALLVYSHLGSDVSKLSENRGTSVKCRARQQSGLYCADDPKWTTRDQASPAHE